MMWPITRSSRTCCQLLFVVLLICNIRFSWQKPADDEYDYIIVGSGTAGSVVAGRLSENTKITVLLLEAGDVPLPLSDIPTNMGAVLETDMVWNYRMEPQKHCCSVFTDYYLTQGKALGGGSSVNGMIYIRGNRFDYDNWKSLVGDDSWGFDALLPYFNKMEDYRIPSTVYDEPFHHMGGPITVSSPSFKTPIADAFLNAGEELHYPITDMNGQSQSIYGFSYPATNLKNGSRWGTYRGYLVPAINRTNLKIVTKAFVTKIDVDAKTKTATGVFFEVEGKTFHSKARVEVILSAGAIQSPKILMLSGIGPRATLTKYGIPVIQHLPGVGQHLQEHATFIRSVFTFDADYPIPLVLSTYDTPEFQRLWEKTKTGPLTSAGKLEGIGFFNSSLRPKHWPDLEVLYYSFNAINRGGMKPEYKQEAYLDPSLVSILIILNRPKSHGYVSIGSTNPHDTPIVNPNYLSNKEDLKALVEGVRFTEKMIKSESFKRFGAKLVPYGKAPECEDVTDVESDKYYECIVRAYLSSGLHPASTCKMASDGDPMGVVDKDLKVRGIYHLRVVDASVMPHITACHPNRPIIMIAEKASDMIKKDFKKNINSG